MLTSAHTHTHTRTHAAHTHALICPRTHGPIGVRCRAAAHADGTAPNTRTHEYTGALRRLRERGVPVYAAGDDDEEEDDVDHEEEQVNLWRGAAASSCGDGGSGSGGSGAGHRRRFEYLDAFVV